MRLFSLTIAKKFFIGTTGVLAIFVASVWLYSSQFGTVVLRQRIEQMSGDIIMAVGDINTQSVTTLVRAIFENYAEMKAVEIETYIIRRERDMDILAGLIAENLDDEEAIKGALMAFYRNNIREYWYNTGTDREPLEVREDIPMYGELSFVGEDGAERYRVVNGEFSADLRTVADITQTGFKNQVYYERAKAAGPESLYYSRLNRWYLGEADIRQSVPAKDAGSKTWNVVPGRDAVYRGDFKIAKAVYFDGLFRGVVVMSFDARRLSEVVKHDDPARSEPVVSTSYEGNYIAIFDDLGDMIVHPKPSNIRGYRPDGTLQPSRTKEFPNGVFNLRDYYEPHYNQIYQAVVKEQRTIVSEAVDVSGRHKMIVAAPIRYDGGEYAESGVFGGVMLSINTDQFYAILDTNKAKVNTITSLSGDQIKRIGDQVFWNIFVLAALTALLLILVLTWLLYRNILRPMKALTRTAAAIGEGHFVQLLPPRSKDEFAVLTTAFNVMASGLSESSEKIARYSRELEMKVQEQTAALQKALAEARSDKASLEQQRRAMLNILEDVSESQQSLERTYRELEVGSRQLSAIKHFGDELSSAADVTEAASAYWSELSSVSKPLCAVIMVANPAEIGGAEYLSFLSDNLPEASLGQIIAATTQALAGMPLLRSLNSVIGAIRPKVVVGKLDNTVRQPEGKIVTLPLMAGNRTLGLVGILYLKEAPTDSPLADALIATLALAIDRLQTLSRAQRSRTASLVESLSDGVIMLNDDLMPVLVNPMAVNYTGLSQSGFTFDNFTRLVSDHDLTATVRTALEHGRTGSFPEVKIGNRYLDIHVTPVRGNEEQIVGAAIILHDISVLREISQMKTDFVSVASHQLRTPLTAIKLFTEMMARGDVGALVPAQMEYLDNIHQSTERMVRLVNDLLNVTRIESGRLKIDPQPTDLAAFLRGIVAEVKPLADPKKVSVKLTLPRPALPAVPLDQSLFRQVVHNLLTNGVRYAAAEKGQVTIKLEQHEDKHFLITVADNGIGIPLESQRRVFEKFYRADNAVKIETDGTGLGLFVANEIVKGANGKIWFESDIGKGTTFFVLMPMSGMAAKTGERGLSIS